MKRLRVTPEAAGRRLDRWLAAQLPDLSRSRIQALIRQGHVTVSGRPVKAHRKLVPGEEVGVEIPEPTPAELRPEDISLDVLYEDADIIVLNKPPGLVVHPAPGHETGTLVNALLHHCKDLSGTGGGLRPGIAHRLDKDTSGVLVVAKNEAALRGLVEQFKSRRVEKEYVALVSGVPKPPSGRVETRIGRSEHDRHKMSARPRRGRPAVTRYRTEETFGDVALLRLWPETGRTHQIRVHMNYLGHPVVGDGTYGRNRKAREMPALAERQMLHAERIAFAHPRTGRRIERRAPLPPDMAAVLRALRSRSGMNVNRAS